MHVSIRKIQGILFVILTVVNILTWANAHSKVYTLSIGASLLFLIFAMLGRVGTIFKDKLLYVYVVYLLISVVRGVLVVENFAMTKNIISNTLCLSLPLLIIPFSDLRLVKSIMKRWLAFFGIPLIFSVFLLGLYPSIQFFFPVYLILLCVIPHINKKRILPLIVLVAFCLFDYGSIRAQTMKIFAAGLSALYIYLNSTISKKIYNFSICCMIILPVVLLVLGISGIFNVFDFKSYIKSDKAQVQVYEDEILDDTRTFIYFETITSAVKHNHIIFGRTPALGNDSPWLGRTDLASKNDIVYDGQIVRNRNEVCFPNVFTWLGLVGCILYSLFYLRAIYLGAFKSSNLVCRGLTVFVAARWIIGWIEDTIAFDAQHIVIWILLAIVSSQEFRRLNDNQATAFFKEM